MEETVSAWSAAFIRVRSRVACRIGEVGAVASWDCAQERASMGFRLSRALRATLDLVSTMMERVTARRVPVSRSRA